MLFLILGKEQAPLLPQCMDISDIRKLGSGVMPLPVVIVPNLSTRTTTTSAATWQFDTIYSMDTDFNLECQGLHSRCSSLTGRSLVIPRRFPRKFSTLFPISPIPGPPQRTCR